MTKADILKAALVVWGRDLYKKTSLSDVAHHLGVTKPALYRHFSSKDALMDALYIDFFDRFAAFLKYIMPSLQKPQPLHDRAILMAKTMTEYFINHIWDFLFFLNLVLGQEKPGRVFKDELERRGLQIDQFDMGHSENKSLSNFRLVSVTVVFAITLILWKRKCQVDEIPADAVADAVAEVSELVQYGLYSAQESEPLPDFFALDRAFNALKNQIQVPVGSGLTASEPLLSAVARAIAEAGPWNASMELVAQKAGLSKSGLYAHFASKEAMLRQLFLSEFDILAGRLEAVLRLSSNAGDKLYLSMRTVADYLRSHRDILLVLDWVRLQRIDLGPLIPERVLSFFAFTRELPLRPAAACWDSLALARWVLFFVVNQLMLELRQGIGEEGSLNNLHDLFIYMTRGVNGWKE